MIRGTAIIIIAINILSVFFWIRFYQEALKKKIGFLQVAKYGIFSSLSALGFIRLFSIDGLATKAGAEELMKTTISETDSHDMPSDHISSAILAGVSFAIVENCIYLYYLKESLLLTSLVRVLSNSIIHGLFTGLIGYGIFIYKKQDSQEKILKKLGLAFTWITLGVGSHYIYNYSLSQSHVAIAFIFIIIGYFGLSFLLYNSDRLYLSLD